MHTCEHIHTHALGKLLKSYRLHQLIGCLWEAPGKLLEEGGSPQNTWRSQQKATRPHTACTNDCPRSTGRLNVRSA